MEKIIRIEMPLDWELSKNRKFIGRTKKVLNPKYKKMKEWIGWLVLQDMKIKGHIFIKEKVWIKIKVYKSMRGDAHNLIEGILDAVKVVIGVDDNLFSVICDYEISKVHKVIIEVCQ
jgi:Holliday junction resolvase RusA-like endonuclease